jgi:hypothetical protein
MNWHSMTTAPMTGEEILAAVQVGPAEWSYSVIAFDAEAEGGVRSDCFGGFCWDEYSFWSAIEAPQQPSKPALKLIAAGQP